MHDHSRNDDDSRQVPESDSGLPSIYFQHLERSKSTGHYFTFDAHYFQILPKLTAIFIQQLINLSNCSVRDGRWFLCTVEYLEIKGWSKKEQLSHIKTLTTKHSRCHRKPFTIEQPLISVDYRHNDTGRARWILIHYDRIEALLDLVQDRNQGWCRDGHYGCCPSRHPTNTVLQTVERNNQGNAVSGETSGVADSAATRRHTATTPKTQKSANQTTKKSKYLDKKEFQPSHSNQKASSPHLSELCSSDSRPATPASTSTQTLRSKGDEMTPLVMGECFRSDNDKRVKQQLSSIDLIRVDKLKPFIKQKGWWCSRSPRNWGQPFRLLRQERPESEIDQVLEFYIKTASTNPALFSKLPTVRNGSDFRRCYDWIKDQMVKNQKVNPLLVISPEAKQVSGHLRVMTWPSGTNKDLEIAVQLSLTAINDFKAKVKATWERLGKGEPEKVAPNRYKHTDVTNLARYAGYVLQNLRSPNQFVTNHFSNLNQWLHRTTNFKGSLISLVVNIEDQKFSYSIHPEGWDTSLWTKLMKEIKA